MSILVIAIFSWFLFGFSSSQPAFPLVRQCTVETTWFDLDALECRSCPSGEIATRGSQTSCQCPTGSARNPADGRCIDCIAMSKAASRDGTQCIPCQDLATLSTPLRDCVCPNEMVLVETSASGRQLGFKQCQLCPNNSRVLAADSYTCSSCPHLSMTMSADGSCICGSGYSAAGRTCVKTSDQTQIALQWPAAQAAAMKYRDVWVQDGSASRSAAIQLRSFMIYDAFMIAAVGCRFDEITAACQSLLNICALQKYDMSSPACSLFKSMSDGISAVTHEFRNWKQGRPMLEFADDSVLTSLDLKTHVALSRPNSVMRYILVSFYLNGSLAGIEDLSSQLQLCPQHPSLVGEFLNFGTTYENKCNLDLTSLVNASPTLFYDLYLVDKGGLIYPIPVKNLNYRIGEVLTNVDAKDAEYRDSPSGRPLQRRFFMYDNLSGKPTAQSATDVIVYAKSITLRVGIQKLETELIYPPLLIIKYAERETSSLSSPDSTFSSISFQSEYVKSLSGLWEATNVLFVMSIVFIAGVWLIEVWKMTRKASSDVVDFAFLLEASFQLISISANVLFWLVYVLATYCLIFFKGQGIAFFLLPAPNGPEEIAFTATIVFVFFAKSLSIAGTVWKQINIDLFFIDWEKPRHSPVVSNADTQSLPVSVWRKLFVANEWNELQSYRMVNTELVLMMVLFLLRGINLEYIATSQPDASNLQASAGAVNIILRFSVTASLLMTASMAQLIYRQLIHHRFFEHKPAQFVDFMTMSNISAFILDDKYHGYYIHGRTLHAFADASMEEMTRQLLMEKKEMVKQRGLSNGKDTFEMFVTPEFRLHYQSIFRDLIIGRMAHSNPGTTGQLAQPQHGQGPDVRLDMPSSTSTANAKLNRFLHNFIDRNSSSYSWEERERPFADKLFDLPPIIRGSPSSIFFDDPNYMFTRVLLMGIEYDLITYLVSLYAVCDLAFDNTFVSILVVFAMSHVISFGRQHWGQVNISKKTLVDDRFLI